jgi:hemoglobin-like flavoprotein
MALSSSEVASVQKSWKEAVAALGQEELGIEVYLAWYSKNPEYIKFFKAFSSSSLAELRGNAAFHKQAIVTIQALDVLIANLGDAGATNAALVKMGHDHKGRHLNAENYKGLHVAILSVLEAKLGAGVDKKAWDKTLAFVGENVIKNL